MLLTYTNYLPKSHKLKFLRKLSEGLDHDLFDIWPRDTKKSQIPFTKLSDAYIKARYSKHYKITFETLEYLGEHITALQQATEKSCLAHLDALKEKAAKEG
jgi:hypothetical protein